MPADSRQSDARGRATVTLETIPVRVDDTLACLAALRSALGAERVFLLESLAGPHADARTSMVGITGLLEISVRRSVVTLTGAATLRDPVRRALLAGGIVRDDAGALRLVDDGALWDLPRVVDAVFDTPRDPDRFGFGVLVFYGYDAVRYIEQLPDLIPDRGDLVPDAIFSLVHGVVSLDLTTGAATLTAAESSLWPPLQMAELVATIEASAAFQVPTEEDPGDVPEPLAVTHETTRDDFLQRTEVCLEHIRVGDIYQVQLGHEIAITSEADDLTVYRRLRSRNPSPYMSLLPFAGHVVIGASPELFVRIDGGSATMRPIAGTARRSAVAAEDERSVAGLLADPKERAEHIMLVDLCRNDLGRVAEPMTVEVTEMMIVEAYSHMFHLVSNVTSRIAAGNDIYDVIRACFPAGTMTGAPKVRAMEIIESLEPSRRGFYAGGFGLIGFGGWSVLGLAIRMVVRSHDRYTLRASAGIVSDSVPDREWQETLTKLGATYWAVTGKEIT